MTSLILIRGNKHKEMDGPMFWDREDKHNGVHTTIQTLPIKVPMTSSPHKQKNLI